MTEMPDASMLISMVREARAGFVDNKWDELLALVDDQANAIERVRELHKPSTKLTWDADEIACDVCLVDIPNGLDFAYPVAYPCDTIKALDGDTE